MSKQEALKHAQKLANKIGAINITRQVLCDEMGIPCGSFQNYTGLTFREFMAEVPSTAKFMPSSKLRAVPELRKDHILNAALELAINVGYKAVTRDTIAEKAGVSPALVSMHFGTMTQLRADLMRRAVKTKNLRVIAQGLANRDKYAMQAAEELKQEAVKWMI